MTFSTQPTGVLSIDQKFATTHKPNKIVISNKLKGYFILWSLNMPPQKGWKNVARGFDGNLF